MLSSFTLLELLARKQCQKGYISKEIPFLSILLLLTFVPVRVWSVRQQQLEKGFPVLPSDQRPSVETTVDKESTSAPIIIKVSVAFPKELVVMILKAK